MSNTYLITNLLNIQDKNLDFSDGIYNKVIKGVTYSILTAKLNILTKFVPIVVLIIA